MIRATVTFPDNVPEVVETWPDKDAKTADRFVEVLCRLFDATGETEHVCDCHTGCDYCDGEEAESFCLAPNGPGVCLCGHCMEAS